MGKSTTKKQKSAGGSRHSSQRMSSHLVQEKLTPFDNSPIFELLKAFEKPHDQWAARYILVLSVILLKAAVGLGSFSGQGQKPINGDFEAQRHWMELSVHLPVTTWYYFDLQYWGLDYPPLTAYHSWALGKIGSLLNPSWFELGSSRGIENPQIKTFMRIACLVSELILYIPAVMQLTSQLIGRKENRSRIHQIVVLAMIFCQPCLTLIDNGHFQFNSVMLGLFVCSMIELLKDNLILASIWFMCSIMFKQMALYYSPFIFAFILSKLFTPRKTLVSTLASLQIGKLIIVGVTVVLTVVAIVSPFLISAGSGLEALTHVKQILTRMFPFERGLFEDKVANFWCTSNVLIKYATRFSASQLKVISFALTLLGALPPCTIAFWKNITRKTMPPELVIYGFSATAWAFYLFSFQVHEKTVLVPLIPSTFLLPSTDSSVVFVIQWINNISAFSLYPLLKKDGLGLQYILCTFLINWLLCGFKGSNWKALLFPRQQTLVLKTVISCSYLAVIVVHALDIFVSPPVRYPDLWTIANTSVSFGCFSCFYLWLVYKMSQL
ncbi:hypothetical protein OXX59_007364 [Metschnikowia pulcherrima]